MEFRLKIFWTRNSVSRRFGRWNFAWLCFKSPILRRKIDNKRSCSI